MTPKACKKQNRKKLVAVSHSVQTKVNINKSFWYAVFIRDNVSVFTFGTFQKKPIITQLEEPLPKNESSYKRKFHIRTSNILKQQRDDAKKCLELQKKVFILFDVFLLL